MLKIITIVNRPEIYDKGLKKSLQEQVNCEYDLSVINNTNNKYTSLYAAYNEVLKSKDILDEFEFILFCHPDIWFIKNDELKRLCQKIYEVSYNNENIGIYGVAGVTFGGVGISNIMHGKEKIQLRSDELKHSGIVKVQTVDSCMCFIRTKCLKKYELNRNNRGFHMLFEEYSLRLYENGIDTVVIPANVWHFSAGASLDYHYYQETKRIAKMHKKSKYINTTSFQWKNNWWLPIKLDFLSLRNFIHHRLSG